MRFWPKQVARSGLRIDGILAVVSGHIALRQIRRSGGMLGERGIAVVGPVRGHIHVAALAVVCITLAAAAAREKWQLGDAAKPWDMSGLPVRNFPALSPMELLGDAGGATGPLQLHADTGPAAAMSIRIYLRAGTHVRASLPCVLIAPAGTNLLAGRNLEEPGQTTCRAADDERVTAGEITAFANAAKANGIRVVVEAVPAGGHYRAMIQHGIPAGIRFFEP